MSGSYETRSLLSDVEARENADDEEGVSSDHCHSLLLAQKEDEGVERALRTVAVLCALFIIAEFVGGILSDSLAIITDAGHLLSDFFSFIVSLAAIRFARRSPTCRTTFGCARAEVLGALFSIFIIWTLTIVLVVFATQRIQSAKVHIDPNVMLATSALAILFNVVMAAALWCFGGVSTSPFMHSHGDSSPSSPIASASSHTHMEISANVNIRAAFVHIFGDFVQSVGVLCAALIVKFTGWTLADPLCTYLFSVIVLTTSFPVLRDICRTLIEATPSTIDYARLYDDLLRLRVTSALADKTIALPNGNGNDHANGALPHSGVKIAEPIRAVHSLHVWALNARQLCASVHLVIAKTDGPIADEIIRKATQELQQSYGIMHTTVQIEIERVDDANGYYREAGGSVSRCIHCQPL